jgi:TolB-like protein
MEVVSGTPPAIRFGSFELDVRSRELRKGENRIRLQDQPFEILRMMLERPGDVVTREELCQRLWPNGTFVDFEHSLNAAVKRLRAALGDDADNPRFVETLPRRGYRFIAVREDSDRAASDVEERGKLVRLAVLPFATLSDDASQEYFADGLTEELIAQLSPLCRGRIAVIARRSSMLFKGTSQPVRDIAHVLRADYLLEGSVRRDGLRVRITVRLIQGDSETELWSDTHERTVDDWLSVQTDVAAHVAQSLLMELVPRHLPHAVIPNRKAHELYLKARYLWALPGDDGFAEGIQCVDEALRIEPDFGAAFGLLARLQIGAAEYYRDVPRRALEAARDAATRALAHDATNSEARAALGDVARMADFDWSRAKALYRDVLASNPSTELAHRGYAVLLSLQGRHDDAIRAADVARELDPLCVMSTMVAAWTRYMASRFEDASEACRYTLGMGPTYMPAVRLLALARAEIGDYRAAAEDLERAIAQVGPHPNLVSTLAHVYGSSGRQSDAIAQLVALRDLERERYVSPYQLALACIGIGNVDEAFDALSRAVRDRDPLIAHAVLEPRFATLRSDARFGRLLESMNLKQRAA